VTLGRKFPSLESRRSGCSVSIGEDITEIKAGLATELQLVVDDVEAARDELSGRGLEVSEVHDYPWGRFVSFTDPDGNGWAVQQIPDYGAGIAGAGQLILPGQQLLGGGLPLLRRHDSC
jgi:hypothetical protein